jgi:hypothetical protein
MSSEKACNNLGLSPVEGHACSMFMALFGHMLPTSLIFLYFVFVAHYKEALSKKMIAVVTIA